MINKTAGLALGYFWPSQCFYFIPQISLTNNSSTTVLGDNLEMPAKFSVLDTHCRCHFCRYLARALVKEPWLANVKLQ